MTVCSQISHREGLCKLLKIDHNLANHEPLFSVYRSHFSNIFRPFQLSNGVDLFYCQSLEAFSNLIEAGH